MRRGLMGWSPEELPQAALDARRARLQAAMAREGFDALVLYTNIVRPSAVCWLTGFTPYWIESLLLLPREGSTLLATALSKRVSDWVRATSRIEDIVNTPKPGTAIGARLAAAKAQRVGVLEYDALPAALYDDIVAAAPAAQLVDATALVAAERGPVDAAERGLIARADALALAALAEVDPTLTDAGALAGLVEKHARLGGAEEVFVAIAPDLDRDARLIQILRPTPLAQRFAVRASVAYKGAWVRRTQSFARDASGANHYALAGAWLDAVASAIQAGQPLAADITRAAKTLPRAELRGFIVEGSLGSYPLEVVASSRTGLDYTPAPDQFLVLSCELLIDGVPWLGAGPVLVSNAAQR